MVVVGRWWKVVVGGPCQSFDNGMVGVNHPTSTLLVEDGAVVFVEEGHGLFFATGSVFCGGAPGEERNDE